MDDDLFGHPTIPDGPAMTLAERRRVQRRLIDQPRGYYAAPGTGPEGESCKTCAHATKTSASGWWKCAKVRSKWRGSIHTDIRLKSPACSGWERITDDDHK